MNAHELLDSVNAAIRYTNSEKLAHELDIEIRLFVAYKLHLFGPNYSTYLITLNR